MTQMRLMGDDPERVRAVAAKLLDDLRAAGGWHLGDPVELANRRGGGIRIVVEVIPVDDEGPIQATATRTDRPPVRGTQRALPPGGRSPRRR